MCECLEYEDGEMHLCVVCADMWRTWVAAGYPGMDKAPAPLLAASRNALTVLTDLAESAAYWSDYDVPVGLVPRVDEARAQLAAALEGGPR